MYKETTISNKGTQIQVEETKILVDFGTQDGVNFILKFYIVNFFIKLNISNFNNYTKL